MCCPAGSCPSTHPPLHPPALVSLPPRLPTARPHGPAPQPFQANVVIVYAKTSPDKGSGGITAFIVEKGMKG